jgi:autotransporter-associated beta strand protein
MINLKNAETGKTTKTFKNPTSTRSPLNTLKSLSAFALVMLLGVNGVMGQTNPTPQSLPYTQNFSTFTGSTITYPSGIQGWTIAGSLSTSYVTTTPSGDFTLASGTNATTTAGVYDMNGKIGTISTGSTLRGICLSIVTTSTTNITLSYVAGTQAQTSGGRINEIGVQYRIGTTGTFTNISGSTYQNNATSTINTGTTASNTSTISVTLPSACENQSVVQLRWVIRDVSGGGSRPSFSVDDISVATATVPSIAISSGSIGAGSPNNGQTNVVLQRYDMAVTTANATLTGLTVTTAGTYAAADLTNLKCWYQTSTTFNAGTATLLSTKTTALGAGSQAFPTFSSQSLVSGSTYYIFVTADIASGATNGNTINIASTAFSNITFSSGTKTGTDPVAAAGVQTITVAVPDIALSSPSASAANITVGTTNNVIYRFDLAITTATPSLTGVTINTSTGSNASGDLTNLKCWYQTSTTFNAGTATLLSTKTTSLAAGSQVFPAFSSQSLTTGSTYYIFITADVPLTATINNTVIVSAITTTDLTFATGSKTGTSNASGTKTIIDCTPADVTSVAASSANQSSVLTWANPSCYDEILIVAALASNTGTPSGNGSAYTGNLAYASGTALGNGFVVYKGSTSSQTVTGLTNGTPYFYKYFTRRGTTWTSGTEVSATPNISGYYWNGASIAANPAAGGTGTWGTTNAWRQPSSTGSQATWVDGSTAVFEGTAGTVTLEANKTVTTFYVNTTNYVLTPDATTARSIAGSTSLSSNVVLNINDIAATSNRTLIFSGNVGGASGSSLNVNVNQITGSTSRINLGAPGTTLSIPITVTAGANNVTYGNMAVVGASTGTILTSAATITNNTNYSSGLGATSGNELTANGVISGSAGLMFAAGSSGGAGTITLNVANTYTGATIFNAANSGVIKLGIANALPTGTNVTMANSSSNGGIFDLNGFNQTIASLTSGAGGGSIRNNGATDATLTISGSTSPAAFALAITDGSTNKTLLTKAGTGTLTLSGTNTYTGATTINEGTLSISSIANGGANSGIGASTNAAANLVLGGGTLQYTGGTASTDRNFTLTDATTSTINNPNQLTITGASTATTGALTKAGAGTLILSGANLYTGLTTISAGTLQLNRTGGTTIPITNNVTISGGTLQVYTDQTLNNVTLTSGTLMVDAGVTLTINGSFTGGGTIENNGTIVLVGPSSFPGATTTISAMNNLAIDRASNVTLDQSITITGNLTLTNGKLITGACNSTTSNIALTMADNATITGSSSVRFVDGILKKTGNDAFTFPIGSGAKYAPVSLTAPFVITDRFAACYAGSNPNSSYSITSKAGSLNNVSKMEYWHINREVGTSSANVTLSWDTIARSGPVRDMTLLRVCHWNSSSSQWTDLGQTGTTGSNASGTITSGSVTSFSPFTLGSSGSANPLPVTWAYFTAKKTDGGNQLDWGTASEKNTSHFEIEYSVDGSQFIAMNNKINAAGNSAHLLEYRCIHKLSPPLIYYRIKQIDLDGLYDYSKTIILKNKDVTSKNFIKVLPSYVQGQEPLTIQGYESNMPFVFYEIINGQGQRILSDKISTIDGYFHHSLSLEMYPTGLYYLRVFNSDLDNIYQGKIRK